MIVDDPNYQIVMDIYGGCCPHCGTPAATVHEIIPKSKLPKHWMAVNNRIPLCQELHTLVHVQGTRKSEPMLRDLQILDIGPSDMVE